MSGRLPSPVQQGGAADRDPPGPVALPVAIVGAGPVGAVAALALAARGVEAQLFDARAPAAGKPDRRAIALSWGTRLALDRLGVWTRIGRADPINRVSVSRATGNVRVSSTMVSQASVSRVSVNRVSVNRVNLN